MEGYHKSVMLAEVIEALQVKAGKWYLDCTLGDGGYSLEILKRGGNALGIDVDPESIKRVKERLGEFEKESRLVLIQGNFRDIKNLIQQTDIGYQKFSGIVFDLGVSSLQLMSPGRGFSFGKEGPLDMRMDPTLAIKAMDLVNNLSRKELNELFSRLGEEKYSWRLADVIVSSREIRKGIGFSSTKELADVIEKAIGKRDRIHPATRVFQALRIAVNDELRALEEGLKEVIDLSLGNGRIVVISFHSLEDRIVKNTFKAWKREEKGEILTKKPIGPSDEETKENPRSRSAKMRVFKKS